MNLPEYFVWTRYGIESGEEIGSIFRRKERERLTSGGTFLWGIGNSVAPSVRKLLAHLNGEPPAIVFSPMLAKPKTLDVLPGRVVTWTLAHGIDGLEWQIPAGTVVTSRAAAGSSDKTRHYALVCRLETPLNERQDGQRFSIDDLRNFASGNRVGHSQVSSVVQRSGQNTSGPYLAAVVAALQYPYVVELSGPEQCGHVSTRNVDSVRHAAPRQLTLESVA